MSPHKNCVVSQAELRPRHQSHCPHCRLRDASSWGHKVSISPHHHNCQPPAELLRADQHIVRGPPVNVHDEAHAARVPLQRGVVQTWGEIVIRSWVVTAGLWSGNHPGAKYLAEYFVQSCKIIMISCCSDWLKYLARFYSFFLDNFLVLVVSGSASLS